MGKSKTKTKAKEKPMEQQLKYVGPKNPVIAARQLLWVNLAFFTTLAVDVSFAFVSHILVPRINMHGSAW